MSEPLESGTLSNVPIEIAVSINRSILGQQSAREASTAPILSFEKDWRTMLLMAYIW